MSIYYRVDLVQDRAVLRELKELYEGVVVDAHVLETFRNAFAKFLNDLALSGKKFVIDPVTYRFAIPSHTPSYANRVWFSRLINAYGLEKKIDEISPYLDPAKLSKKDIAEITQKVIEYQEKTVPRRIKEVIGLLAYIGIPGTVSKSLEPSYVIPPYIVIGDYGDAYSSINRKDALKFNLACIEYAKQVASRPVMAMIAIDNSLLLSESQEVLEILDKYVALGADAYAVWITALDESKAVDDLLYFLFYIYFNLRYRTGQKAKIWSMYSGYFSVILLSLGLVDYVVQGVGYAEHRDPLAVSGPALRRYYNHISHKFDYLERAIDFFKIAHKYRCNCPICSKKNLEELKGNDLKAHYVYTRYKEVEKANNIAKVCRSSSRNSIEVLICVLEKNIELLKNDLKIVEEVNNVLSQSVISRLRFLGKIPKKVIQYDSSNLEVWIRVLERILDDLKMKN